jgi:hypothetical protein
MGANCFPWYDVINMHAQCDPPRQRARLAQWLFAKLTRPDRLPNPGFVFPIIGPFGLVDPGRGGVIDAHG